jgi:hypothetical protein
MTNQNRAKEDDAIAAFIEPGRRWVDPDAWAQAIGVLVPADSLLQSLADDLASLAGELADPKHRELATRLALRARAGAALHGHRSRGV